MQVDVELGQADVDDAPSPSIYPSVRQSRWPDREDVGDAPPAPYARKTSPCSSAGLEMPSVRFSDRCGTPKYRRHHLLYHPLAVVSVEVEKAA